METWQLVPVEAWPTKGADGFGKLHFLALHDSMPPER